MKIYLDNNLGVSNVEQEELTQDTIGYNILKVYIPNAVLTPYNTFTCYYGALLQNGRKVGWFAMEARTSSDADYEANYTLYKATLEQCVVSVEGKVYIGCQVLLGNSGNATLIKKNTAVVQFNVRKSVAINNDILVLDTDQTTTDVLESYKQLLENALTTYATKAEIYTQAQINALLLQKADKSDTYTKTEVDTKDLNLAGQIASARLELNNAINATNTQLGITDDKVTALQDDVADLKSVQNVVDVVATKSALNSYDTSKLGIDDKIQVIADETHDSASTIYNWNGSAWQYVGAFGGNSYTKAESDTKFAPKTTAVTHTGNQLQDYSGNNIYPNLSPSLYYKNETLIWNYLSYNGYSLIDSNTTYILDNLIVSACVLSKIKLYAHSAGVVNIYLLQQNSGTYFTAYKKISLNVENGEHTYYLDDEIIVNDNTYIAVNGANIICYKNTTQNGSYTNNLYQISRNVVLGTSQFYSKIDNIKFSFMFEIYTYKRSGSIGKLLNTFNNSIIVDKSGNGDYTTIQEAVNSTSPSKNYIYIKSGIYEEEVDARKTYPIYLIGENRETTILKSGYAKYEKPPLFHNMGCVKNMTIIAYNDGVHAPDPDGQTTGEQWGAYAIHCDNWDGSNNSYDVDNCTLISYWNASIGIGTYSNYGVTIRNSDLISYNQYFTSQSNNNGAIIIHDRINTTATGQYVTLDNCKLYAKYGNRVINIQTLQDEGEFKLTFHNNSLYNENTNQTGNSVVWITHNYNHITSFDQAPDVVHSGLSFGNSADILNY